MSKSNIRKHILPRICTFVYIPYNCRTFAVHSEHFLCFFPYVRVVHRMYTFCSNNRVHFNIRINVTGVYTIFRTFIVTFSPLWSQSTSGEVMEYGEIELKYIMTPGKRNGTLLLYSESEKMLCVKNSQKNNGEQFYKCKDCKQRVKVTTDGKCYHSGRHHSNHELKMEQNAMEQKIKTQCAKMPFTATTSQIASVADVFFQNVTRGVSFVFSIHCHFYRTNLSSWTILSLFLFLWFHWISINRV